MSKTHNHRGRDDYMRHDGVSPPTPLEFPKFVKTTEENFLGFLKTHEKFNALKSRHILMVAGDAVSDPRS